MRKIVVLTMEKGVKDFRPQNLQTLMRAKGGDPELLEYLEEWVREASLRKLAEHGPLLQLELDYTFYRRRSTGKLVEEKQEGRQRADVWVRKGYSLALASDLPASFSRLASALLSAGLYGETGGVVELEFDRGKFGRLLERVEEKGGKLVSVHLRGAMLNGEYKDVVQVSSSKGVGRAEREAVMSCKKIKRLGFHLTLGEEFYHFWIAAEGNGTLYSPSNPLPHHYGELLRFLEEAIL